MADFNLTTLFIKQRWFIVCLVVYFYSLFSAQLIAAPNSQQLTHQNIGATSPILEKDKEYSLQIPRSDVAQALNILSEQTDIAVLFPYSLAKTKQANAIIGYYTISQALDALLSDSGLTGVYSVQNGIRVFHQPANVMPAPIANLPESEPLDPTTLNLTELDEASESEVISIYSLVNQQSKSINQKRYSNFIVDSYIAKNLGQLPVQDISQALQRISGVTINRQDDRGVFASVRGFGPEFNTVLYNGRVIATENQGREFSFDVLSPEVINGADVYKSSSTEVITGSIGSTINLTIPKPMQHQGFNLYSATKLTYNSLSNNNSPEFVGLMSYATDEFGALVSINYQDREYEVESAHTDGWFLADLSYVDNKLGEGDFANVWVPRNFDLRIDQGHKIRLGGSIVLEAKLTNNLKATLDVLYSKYEVESNIRSSANWTHIYNNQDGSQNESLESVEIDSNNTLIGYRYQSDQNFATDFVELNRNRPTKTSQVGLNFDWDATQRLGVSFDFSYSSAANDNGGKQKFIIAGAPNANPIYQLDAGRPYANLTYQRPVSVGDLRSHGTIYSGDDIKDAILQSKVDAEYLIDFGIVDKINFGGYVSTRNKTKAAYKTPWGWEFAGYEFDIPDSLFTPIDTSDFLSGHVPAVWYSFDADDYVDFLWSDENIQTNIINTGHWLADSILLRKAAGGVSPVYYPSNSWQVEEDLVELYSKLSLSGDFYEMPWHINMGLRYADTSVTSRGTEQDILDIEYVLTDPTNLTLNLSDPKAILKRHHYQHFLSELNVKIELNDEQILRFALYNSITRPSLNRLSANLGSYNARVGASTARAGDPYLMPYEASNFDAAWSWYFSDKSYLSASYFYKNIDNFVSEKSNVETLFDHPEGQFLVVRPVNGEPIQVNGIELAITSHLDFISPHLQGVELQARYTWVNGNNPNSAIDAASSLSIEGLSNSYNFVASYKRGAFEGVIAYSFRGSHLRQASGAQGQPEMVADYGQTDANINWHISPIFTLFVESSNLFNAKSRTYSIYQARLLNYENSGSRFSLGFKAHF